MEDPDFQKSLQTEIDAHNRTREKLQYLQSQLQEVALELSLAEERERRTIAAELHDHIGQALAFIKLKISSLQGNTIFCGFEDDFSEIMLLLDQTINYTRNLTFEISPPILYEFGLEAALEWLGENFQKKHHIKVNSISRGKKIQAGSDLQIMLYKSVRELLKNIEKHAKAHRVDITVIQKKENLTITVKDDGCGFDPTTLLPGSRSNRSFGLFSIKERLNYFGGGMKIDSAENRGTKITLEVKIRAGE